MPKALFDRAQKDLALKLIAEGALSVTEISRETGIVDKNIARWKSEMNHGEVTGRKRRRRTSVVPAPEKPVDWELRYNLERLENEHLRIGLGLTSYEDRLKQEIVYLRMRASMFGDDTIAPLFFPIPGDNPAETETEEKS